jgi:transcriptional regulator with XRE-family HTH domain
MDPGGTTMARINFGYVLRKLRHNRDETLEQVSEATGLSVAMLSRVERGERLPSPDSVEALARHFEIPVDYLMSETIANRMVNRYGEESSRSAAEHMSREPEELGLFAPEPAATADVDADAARPVSERRQRPRSYGLFKEMDIGRALASPTGAPPRPPSPASLASPASFTDQTRSAIDPAAERVLRAAMEASEAAAVLVLRETPSLSRDARVQLIGQITSLAGQAIDALRILTSDPDASVRAAAREALARLTRA